MVFQKSVERCLSKHLSPWLLLTAAILLLHAAITNAAVRYWSVESGDWSSADNWVETEPTSNDDAYVVNDGTAIQLARIAEAKTGAADRGFSTL